MQSIINQMMMKEEKVDTQVAECFYTSGYKHPSSHDIRENPMRIKDPCRPGVKAVVEACQHAGVNVKMITGDNVFTAKAIAIE
ncbi:hypothetical protein Fmac_003108 [Flemingia macrophylla]|uniref:Uncharacterized protein n=1 Tax=Flemingia macrophylla TaxID=520843 RepID=A0ABD1NLV4_9FABA